MRTLALTILCLGCGTLTAADSGIDQILAEHGATVAGAEAEYAAEVAQAQNELEAATLKADGKAITALERTAKRAARSGDMATGAAAWKAILGLDREHPEARSYFEAVGNLDTVLAELDQADAARSADLFAAAEAEAAPGGPATGEPLALALLGSFGQVQVLDLTDGTHAIGGVETPITAVPAELTGASFIQPPLVATEYVRCRTWRAGLVALVVGPGYGGLRQVQDAGFERAGFALGVSHSDQPVYLKQMAAGEELNLPPGPVMVIAERIRPLPAELLHRGRR